jgi:hypothetical protein
MGAGKFFSRAIRIFSGFTLRSRQPLDSREVVSLLTDLATFDPEQLYEGLRVFCEEDKKEYIYKNSAFHPAIDGGNADTANTLSTPRNISVSVSGVEATRSFNGGSNVSIPITLKQLSVDGQFLTLTVPYNGGQDLTIQVNATNNPTPDTLVSRSAQGDTAVNVLTCTGVTCTGAGHFAGGAFKRSDARVKSDITVLDEKDLKDSKFIELKKFTQNGKVNYGAIAQEVLITHPELIGVDSEDFYTLDYTSLLCLKMKALEAEVKELKDIIQTLVNP